MAAKTFTLRCGASGCKSVVKLKGAPPRSWLIYVVGKTNIAAAFCPLHATEVNPYFTPPKEKKP